MSDETHFDRLFSNRQEGDYADFVVFNADEVRPWLEQTRAFVDHIVRIVDPSTNTEPRTTNSE